jgi:hypothetical protein
MSFNFESLKLFFEKFNYVFILWSLLIVVIFAYLNKKKFFGNNKNKKNVNKVEETSTILNNDETSSIWLNNCLKWIYFNYENTKNINNTLLKSFNDSVNFIFLRPILKYYAKFLE